MHIGLLNIYIRPTDEDCISTFKTSSVIISFFELGLDFRVSLHTDLIDHIDQHRLNRVDDQNVIKKCVYIYIYIYK